MDFFRISERKTKNEGYIVKPDFLVKASDDLMIRGKAFYAIWDETTGLWTTKEYRVGELVDAELYARAAELSKETDQTINVAAMLNYSSNSWKEWRGYLTNSPDNYHSLDQNVKFMNDEVTKDDYATFTLPYCLSDTPTPNYDALMSVIYEPEEREKLEWAIGSIVAGESKNIQKFFVLYGSAGSGKSTFLNILEQLFAGYTKKFEAQELGQRGNQFSMESFRTNPLVAIQHDGDLSRLEDNTRINSIVSHEEMIINEKHKSNYQIRLSAMLFMGTNQPVRITDAKSGIIRRLIDVHPSGEILNHAAYRKVMQGIPFELGGIAQHCLDVFNELGPDYYDKYTPIQMMYQTDSFFNFVEEYYYDFKENNLVTLSRAWELYKKYCEDAAIPYRMPMLKVKEELKNYFENFYETKRVDGEQKRKVYMNFKAELFMKDGVNLKRSHIERNLNDKDDDEESEMVSVEALTLNCQESEVDILLKDCPAQYATENGTPLKAWDSVTTTLKEIDTASLHYVRPPENHIVIDFDLTDENGNKDARLNLEAAATWPMTYAEFSKGGAGVHLHYIYDGDVSKLSSLHAPGIEVKKFLGKAALRRKLSYCNNLPVAHLSSGLPLKEEKKSMINFNRVMSEKGLRSLIERNLRKEIAPSTKSSIDFIYNDLEAAYANGLVYDVRDLRPKVLAFANNSSHQRDYCIRLVAKMKFMSENTGEEEKADNDTGTDDLVFFDIECFPNLFLICWKKIGEGQKVVRMYNPKPEEVGALFKMKLVGFNNRKYDNHMLYGAYLGYSNQELFTLSQRLIEGSQNATFREAYNLSHADIYEFSAKKQSLKKFEIELGIHHQENAYPWDKPLPEDKWEEVGDYCENDVLATEATFNARYSDYVAYEMIAEVVGMPVNSNGNAMAARLIFGNDKHPPLIYTDLATGKASDPEYQRTDIITAFPGYEYKYDPETKKYINWYRDTDVGYGGYVYAEPGMYTDVALIDVASMHPHSAIAMNYFGPYTKRFEELVETRVHIKHKEYDVASKLFDGKFAKFLKDPSKIKGLAYALKIFVNKTYGMTSARFDNEFKDKRNVNNIIALRGALFMRTLQDEVVARGFKVAHIKTDSIKIPNATPEIIQFCLEFAKQYGYTFEHEGTYDRMCLVNDAVYIAKYATAEKCKQLYGYVPGDNAEHPGQWTATGTQFQVPFVFKTLFSKDAVDFKDLCETKSVTTALYLDFNEGLPDVSAYEAEYKERNKSELLKWEDQQDKNYKLRKWPYRSLSDEELSIEIAKGHDYKFVGKIGLFTPVVSGIGGGLLVAERNNNGAIKYDSVGGAKGYRWLESETVKSSDMEDKVDLNYYRALVDSAKDSISKYGDFEWFVSDDTEPPWDTSDHPPKDDVPWLMPCKDLNKTVCEDCPEFATCPYISHENCDDKDPMSNNCVDCPNKDQCQDQIQAVLDEAAGDIFDRR